MSRLDLGNWFPADALPVPPVKQVGLLAGFRRPAHWDTVVRTFAGRAEARLAAPRADVMDAWLASSPDVADLDRAVATGVAVAVLAAPGDELAPEVVRITTDFGAAAAGQGCLYFPADGIDAGSAWPSTPFVRARWRRRHDLPQSLVVDLDGIADDLVPTALALASAVVVHGRRLVEAMAWGAACVTDADSARAADAVPGDHVVVAANGQAAGRALAADDRLAARLGRAARRLVEARHDIGRAGLALYERLGLATGAPGACARLEDRLAELATPAEARITERAREALAGLAR